MKELIEFIIKGIVDKPEEVEINQIIGEKTLIFEIKADPQDVGKIIGKQGRNIKSIRTIANAAAQNSNKRVIIEIIN
ncbi:MAG: KH domain-containing protein [Atribacterota bacterium]